MKTEDYQEEFDFSDTVSTDELYYENLYNNQLKDIFSKKDKTKEIYEYENDSNTWDEVQERFNIDKNVTDTFVDNIKTDMIFKKIYAIVLLIILSLQLIMVNIAFILRGINIINCSDISFNIFISGALIEVIALVTIVVKYLFKDNISEALKNILEKNRKK